MLLVIFGAGASHDSYSPQPAKDNPLVAWRPPLARELFSRAEMFGEVQRFPACQPVAPRLHSLPGGITLEQELEDLQREADDGDPLVEVQLTAVRYYLQYAIAHLQKNWRDHTKGVSNYKTLLEHIRSWRRGQSQPVCLVTFNYDSLLETALEETPWAPRHVLSSVSNHVALDYKIFKLHGSVLWAREIATEIPEITAAVHRGDEWEIVRTVINRAPELNVTDRYVIMRQYPVSTLNKIVALFPAIAIPVQRKQEYECPEEHIQVLDEWLPKTSHVVIIGWRGREERFVEKLVAALPKDVRSVIVSHSLESAAEIKGFLQASGYPEMIATAADGFTGFILKKQLARFLSWTHGLELHLD